MPEPSGIEDEPAAPATGFLLESLHEVIESLHEETQWRRFYILFKSK